MRTSDLAIQTTALGKAYRSRRRVSGFWPTLASYVRPHFDSIPALHDFSVSIERGENVGLIGENGAGKSTALKLITGILFPSAGTVRTLGRDPWRDRKRVALDIGVVFGQRPQLLWDIPVADSLQLMRDMYGVPSAEYQRNLEWLVDSLALGSVLSKPVRQLSLGQRMRCDLAGALIHGPALLFLDEPTLGLDVVVKEKVRELLREARKRFATTLLLTTHDVRDISATCERLLVLEQGRLLYDGDLKGFERRFSVERVILAELSEAPCSEVRRELEEAIHQQGSSLSWETSLSPRVSCPGPESVPQIVNLLLRKLLITDLTLQGTEIDAAVARFYRSPRS